MNTNNELVKKIMELRKNKEDEKIRTLLEDMLKDDPKNIDLWMRLAIFELNIFHDLWRSIECLEEILKIEKDHPIALLVLSDIQVGRMGNIDEKMMKKISSLTTDSPAINSMLRFAAAGFYEKDEDFEKRKKLLEESINFYQGHVWNYVSLANLYFFKERKAEAKELIKKALNNVRKVYKIEDWKYDPSDVNELLYEFFNGLQLSSHKYELIKGKLDL